MQTRTLIILIFSCLLNPLHGFSQDSTMRLPATWTLKDCIEYARQNNIQINSLRLTSRTDQQNLLQSKAAIYPNLSSNSSQTYTNTIGSSTVPGGGDFSSSYAVNSGITIYNGGYLKNDIRQKNLMVQASQFDVQAMENNITLQVAQAYLNILLAKENIIYLNDLLQTSQAQLKQGTLLYNAGSIAKINFIAYQSQVATDNYNLIASQNSERQNTLTLKQLLQLPSGYGLTIIQPDTILTTSAITNLETAQNESAAQRPEIKSSRLNVDIANIALQKAKASGLPVVSGLGSLGTGYASTTASAYMKQLDYNFYQRIGISLSLPIFNNRLTKTNVENAKIEIEQAELNLKNTETVLSQEVEQAYISVLNAQAEYEAAIEQLKTSRETFEISGEQLRLGAITAVDYLLQKNLYIQALEKYIQAKYNTAIALKVYNFYQGIPVTN